MHLGVAVSEDKDQLELYQRLLGRYIRQYWHMYPEPYRGVTSVPPATWWRAEDFTRYQVLAEQAGGIPTLNLSDHRIRLDSELATAVFDWARRYSNLKVGEL